MTYTSRTSWQEIRYYYYGTAKQETQGKTQDYTYMEKNEVSWCKKTLYVNNLD